MNGEVRCKNDRYSRQGKSKTVSEAACHKYDYCGWGATVPVLVGTVS